LEILNNEKITPFYLKLCKGSKNSALISDICVDTGTPFSKSDNREEFIVRYFKNVFKVPDNCPDELLGCVENFLGEFATHPLV
jgi:hypothetical protein